MKNSELLKEYSKIISISKISNKYKLNYKELINIMYGYGPTSKETANKLNFIYNTDKFKEEVYNKESKDYVNVDSINEIKLENEKDEEIAKLKDVINLLLNLI